MYISSHDLASWCQIRCRANPAKSGVCGGGFGAEGDPFNHTATTMPIQPGLWVRVGKGAGIFPQFFNALEKCHISSQTMTNFLVGCFCVCCLYLIYGNVIFIILEYHAFQNMSHVVSFKHLVFAYLCIHICILHLIHGNVIFDILESHDFQKYSTC